MSLLNVLLVLASLGAILWLIVTFIPMPQRWKQIILAIAAICVILWLLQVFGLLDLAGEVTVPQVK